MKRNPRKLGWTKAFRRAHGKEMTVDSTLAFAARRNIPVRYNRELAKETLRAMERVEEIRSKRERRFFKERMKGNREKRLEEDRKLVAEHQHLLPPQLRDEVGEVLKETEMVEGKRERLAEEEEWEGVEEEELKEKQVKKKKLRMLVDGGVEEMDVDG
ncbi:MAG: ATPase-activating ribosome biosynthesis protein [Bogoriella megaspora]|nr:MAG: ATPase-activating ribosome biosynthesis protein [Bogoriella megaspora]